MEMNSQSQLVNGLYINLSLLKFLITFLEERWNETISNIIRDNMNNFVIIIEYFILINIIKYFLVTAIISKIFDNIH